MSISECALTEWLIRHKTQEGNPYLVIILVLSSLSRTREGDALAIWRTTSWSTSNSLDSKATDKRSEPNTISIMNGVERFMRCTDPNQRGAQIDVRYDSRSLTQLLWMKVVKKAAHSGSLQCSKEALCQEALSEKYLEHPRPKT
jgi:hypothetical protein